ncbi:MAG TPA: dihydroorotate dehydrogenase electron transfer subunit [Actinomycetota bacterium]|nr:dihydroorotate dehydrogenase electron transfer subunit [Actinomycetota bacterium]
MTTAATIAQARVASVRTDGPYTILAFEAAEIAASAAPGQFVNVAQDAFGCLLRRPFSILDVDGDRVEIGFDTIGEGTRRIAASAPGDRLDVVGPLGTAYTMPAPGGSALLVGGGYGAAPLFFLARLLRAQGTTSHMILGAATKGRLFAPDRGANAADTLTITTDDGSTGLRGRVTDAMDGIEADAIYACGPMPMLAAVAARANGRRCEVAVEEFMACGVGVCWTCVVPTHDEGYRHHQRACTDGPVFDGSVIAWP